MSKQVELVIQIFAIIFTVLAFLSASLKTMKQRNAKGISWISQSILMIGIFLWLVFGTTTSGQLAAGAVNIVLIPMVLYILYMSFRDNGGLNNYKCCFIFFSILLSLVGTPIFIISYVQGDNSIFKNDIISSITLFIGSTFTAVAFLPQTLRTFKSKDVKNLSFFMPFFYAISYIFWILIFSFALAASKDTLTSVKFIYSLITSIFSQAIYISLTLLITKYKKIK